MPYEAAIDVVQILRATLYLLEHGDYPEKNIPSLGRLTTHLRNAIEDVKNAREKVTVIQTW